MEPLKHRTINSSARSLSELVHDVESGDLDLDAPYQRGHVWTYEQRVNLIKSLLLGVPVAAIVISNRGANTWWKTEVKVTDPFYACIDGKQRITTALMFMRSKLAVPAWWFDETWLTPTPFTTVYYGELTLLGQRFFRNQAILPVAEAKLRDIAEEAEVYDLINSAGTAHSDADLAAARALKS